MADGAPPVGSGKIHPLDKVAHAELLKASDNRVGAVRARAEKWIGGLTGLSGLLAIVFVLKGPESVTKIQTGWKIGLATALALALVALAFATYKAYSGAFGSAINADQISPQPIDDLHKRLFEARLTAESKGKKALKTAVISAFVGIFLAAAAITASWFAPEQSSGAGKSLCLVDNTGVTLVRLPGSTLEVESLKAGLEIKSC